MQKLELQRPVSQKRVPSSGTQYAWLHYETLDSTNAEANRLYKAGKIVQPTILLADSQTAGRGTRGRQWVSPAKKGLYMSVIHPWESLLNPSLDEKPFAKKMNPAHAGPEYQSHPINNPGKTFMPADLWQWYALEQTVSNGSRSPSASPSAISSNPLNQSFPGFNASFTMAAAVAAIQTLHSRLDPETGLGPETGVGIKPVNDLFFQNKKLGGILVEAIMHAGQCNAVITGFGLNVMDDPAVSSYAGQTGQYGATSLSACFPKAIAGQWQSTAALVSNVIQDLAEIYAINLDNCYRALFNDAGSKALYQEYLTFTHLYFQQTPVSLSRHD
ncbi:MAG: hypothetical protein AAGI66_07140 [Cyanobacteria bacterium P01_H01_bin.74]